MPTIRRALISVSDKGGIVEFARILTRHGVAIVSSGGTAAELKKAGVSVTDVAQCTGFAEMLDGRVKTLHPRIHAGILAIRSSAEHMAALKKEGIEPIDLVVVNLYPFAQTVAKAGAAMADAIEQIDIGGPSLLRAAAKNYQDVVVLCDPADYSAVSDTIATGASISEEVSLKFAQKAFAYTAYYDSIISRYLDRKISGPAYPAKMTIPYDKASDLRYGENPHQKAAWYKVADEPLLIGAPLQGKELSYNNLLDADAAIACVREFSECAVVIVKHTNPCGVGVSASSLAEAYERALACDSQAAFGGIVACNRPVDCAAAESISKTFFEVVCAPSFDDGAGQVFSSKKNLRLLIFDPSFVVGYRVRSACAGRLVQEADERPDSPSDWKIVTKRAPTAEERTALEFAWKVAKHVQSNAIVISDFFGTIGIGAGQMSRVDSARIACEKVGSYRRPATGDRRPVAAASDAFFPFRDGIDELVKAGVTAVIQPGGSVRDEEVIAAANEHRIAMVFTGIRHFRH